MSVVINATCFGSQKLLGVLPVNMLFSWQIIQSLHGSPQERYQIQLSRHADFSSVAHDTGWVESRNSVNVSLNGFIPLSCTRYWFRVRIHCKAGSSAWSEVSWFETAFLTSREWRGQWITPEQENEPVESVNYLSHCFTVEKAVCSARIYSSALGIYQLCINHKQLDRELFSPGWTSYDDHLQYQTRDISEFIEQGQNHLVVSLAEGWYKGELSWLKKRELYGKRKAFLGQLHIQFTDGEERVISSNETWLAGKGPITQSGFYSGETYDARIADPDNDSATTGSWTNTAILPVKYNLVPQIAEPVRVTETLSPVSLTRDPDGVRIIDMGQNMVGRLRFRGVLGEGETLTIYHAEVLDQQGRLYTENLRNAQQKIVITGNGAEIDYASRFSFQGFRFVMIDGGASLSDPYLFNAITGEVLHTDMERTGDFSCDNPSVNQLFKNILWGQRGNFLDVPTDCPQRDERLGWTGDAHIFMRTGATNYNVHRFFRKWLMSVSAEQKSDGTVPMVVPDILREYISKTWGDKTYTSSGWGDAVVICPWVAWQMYGDRQLLAEQYPSMKAWVQYIHQTGDDPWLWDTGFQFGDWLALDAEPDSYFGATPVYLVATAFYAWSTQLLGRAARALGHDEDARLYTTWSEQISRRFREQFMSDGKMVADTQTAHILPLAFGLLSPHERQPVADRLAQMVKENGYHLKTGFLGTPWLCSALSEHGHHETALRLICQKSFPSWLFSVEQGATTVWEHWDGIKPDGSFWSRNMNSFNHYAYGAVGEWIYRYVAGIDFASDSAAWDKIVFRPDLSGSAFKKVAAHYDSVRGRVAIQWEIGECNARLELTVPGNAQAELLLPDYGSLRVTKRDTCEELVPFKGAITFAAGSHTLSIEGLNASKRDAISNTANCMI